MYNVLFQSLLENLVVWNYSPDHFTNTYTKRDSCCVRKSGLRHFSWWEFGGTWWEELISICNANTKQGALLNTEKKNPLLDLSTVSILHAYPGVTPEDNFNWCGSSSWRIEHILGVSFFSQAGCDRT